MATAVGSLRQQEYHGQYLCEEARLTLSELIIDWFQREWDEAWCWELICCLDAGGIYIDPTDGLGHREFRYEVIDPMAFAQEVGEFETSQALQRRTTGEDLGS